MRVAAVRPALTRTDRWLIGRVPALTVWLGPSVRTGIASSVSRSAEVPGFMTFTVLVSAVLGALMALLPDTSYTELPGLLIGAAAIALINPAGGVATVVAYVATDVLSGGELNDPYFTQPVPVVHYLASRVVAYMVLTVLLVHGPALVLAVASTSRTHSTRLRWAATAVAAAALAWLWSQAAVVLIRPVFLWRDVTPGIAATDALRSDAALFAAVAGAIALGRMVAEERLAGSPAEPPTGRRCSPLTAGPTMPSGSPCRRPFGGHCSSAASIRRGGGPPSQRPCSS